MKIIYTILGLFCTGLGAIGVILPILPTTPFLLLATFFFVKGSQRFHNWFVETKLYKNHLNDFIQNKEMTMRKKVVTLTFASSMLLIAFFSMINVYGRASIIAVMIFKYYYFFFRIKTV